jgi:hypothetical protein
MICLPGWPILFLLGVFSGVVIMFFVIMFLGYAVTRKGRR